MSASNSSAEQLALPDDARAIISVASSDGTTVLTDHEVKIINNGDGYVTEQLQLKPGVYKLTEFIILEDSVGLYVIPKEGAELATLSSDVLPRPFSLSQGNLETVSTRVMDIGINDLKKFGYASAKAKARTVSVVVTNLNGSAVSNATAELRQNDELLQSFSWNRSRNTITLGGDHKAPYTLTVITADAAKTVTFDIKSLKKELGKRPLQIQLEPALVLTLHSYHGEQDEYEEFYEFRMEGQGTVNINWGDGQQSTLALPFQVSHEYFTGDYKAIITGDIHQVTDFSGFSYSTIMYAITGLTNLTALKVYDPSWGAVPIKVDLSNCNELERINIAKYGAPYEPADLRTDFKLPTSHRINTFILDAPSFDSNREFISAEELDVMVSNVYYNTVQKQIYNGKFFVNPVVEPSAATQQKLDILENVYQWQVGFNDEIYEAYNDEFGRRKTTSDPESRREQWLREKYKNSESIILRARESAMAD